MYGNWEPMLAADAGILPHCLKRIEKDIKDIATNPPQGIFALPDEDNLRIMELIITGPSDTPYHGGMFRFRFGFAENYPIDPPKVKLLTTGGNTVQFNPHMYANGRLCLTILGTNEGSCWSPAMNLSSVAVSIQSLMVEKPWRIEEHNLATQHETIRLAVIDVMEKVDTYHEYFAEKIKATFDQNYDHYLKVCNSNKSVDGNSMMAVCNGMTYQFENMLNKLENLKNSCSQ